MNFKLLLKPIVLGVIIGFFVFVAIYIKPGGNLNADALQPQDNLGDVVILPKKDSIVMTVKQAKSTSQYEGLFFWDSTEAQVDFAHTKSDGSITWQDVGPGAKKFIVSQTLGSTIINVPVSGASDMIVLSDIKLTDGGVTKSLSITHR